MKGFMIMFQVAVCLLVLGVGGTGVEAMTEQELAYSGAQLKDLATRYETSFQQGDLTTAVITLYELIDVALTDPVLNEEITEFVILIPNILYSWALLPYVPTRTSQGFTVQVHDLAAELGWTYTAHDIRAFLQERYNDEQLRYLIIIGNENLIPMLPAYSHSGNDFTYTDYYYADLQGDWDADGDSVYGEAGDDAVDFIPEFIVSRIPCDNSIEAFAILNRALFYRFWPSPAKDNGILMAGTVAVQGETGLLQNLISLFLSFKQFTTVRIYDTDAFSFGFFPWPLEPDYTYDEISVPEVWNSGEYSLVYDISHGSATGVTGFSIDEVPSLAPTFPGYFVAAACATSYPGSERNFSEELLFTGGCAGVIGSTNVVHPGDGLRILSGIFAEVGFAMAATRPGDSLGQAMNAIKVLYYQLFVQNEFDPEWRATFAQNLLGYTFYGDPEVPLRAPLTAN